MEEDRSIATFLFYYVTQPGVAPPPILSLTVVLN